MTTVQVFGFWLCLTIWIVCQTWFCSEILLSFWLFCPICLLGLGFSAPAGITMTLSPRHYPAPLFFRRLTATWCTSLFYPLSEQSHHAPLESWIRWCPAQWRGARGRRLLLRPKKWLIAKSTNHSLNEWMLRLYSKTPKVFQGSNGNYRLHYYSLCLMNKHILWLPTNLGSITKHGLKMMFILVYACLRWLYLLVLILNVSTLALHNREQRQCRSGTCPPASHPAAVGAAWRHTSPGRWPHTSWGCRWSFSRGPRRCHTLRRQRSGPRPRSASRRRPVTPPYSPPSSSASPSDSSLSTGLLSQFPEASRAQIMRAVSDPPKVSSEVSSCDQRTLVTWVLWATYFLNLADWPWKEGHSRSVTTDPWSSNSQSVWCPPRPRETVAR